MSSSLNPHSSRGEQGRSSRPKHLSSNSSEANPTASSSHQRNEAGPVCASLDTVSHDGEINSHQLRLTKSRKGVEACKRKNATPGETHPLGNPLFLICDKSTKNLRSQEQNCEQTPVKTKTAAWRNALCSRN
ncbi:palmitoyl-protein thioesterase 1 [Platysternon megacephalum]|uniref:Palmitoyl-protein thioesterase 1 n=1 Tax=Platysternon megacephalum TaxID=55544 RepID=A0A4D9F648_9SAUR|nr:palmitoyl-protein thioesterase 1 [Platysternon megacephalum]